ncbi:alpha-D-ribose 1-methylphosphonate 5-triphosphate synthase subunit PhnG [Bradyrhizobium diazoefficiens]
MSVAIECDLPALTDQNHPDVGWTDAGQPFQLGKWVIDAADVRHQRGYIRVGFEHPYGVTDRATPDRYVAAFEALAQSRSTKLVIYKTDDPVAS